jgi:protein-tyrosine-phosphatase
MAEAICRHRRPTGLAVASAGLVPGPALHPLAKQVLGEVGLELVGHAPSGIGRHIGLRPIDHLIVLSSKVSTELAGPLPGVLHRQDWDVADPIRLADAPEGAAAFRAARDELAGRIDRWLAELP